ncbi:alanine--tRNA ligase [Candidatus Zinderia endosymbiont of Aphrophora alni]|uniref:alanine--tRNA ligase n=1 Tax=Candidatus Zinderia endosymbiont of Aphrophora alni TaxID=3077951 RepID=UPI0030D56413
MKLEKIKKIFIDFFISKKHTFVPSSSLVAKNDPTIMFANSGMVQFKNIFLGIEKPKYKRITSIQRCIRVGGKHNDLENVGYTSKHHTFFEMLGNWSFGDYFKYKTLKWSWELLTKIYKLSEDKLLITIHKNDEESYEIWTNKIGISKKKIFLINNNSDNFWQMANTGPCGPCSEIFYEYKKNNNIVTINELNNNSNYIEIWNNVFLEFNKKINKKTNQIILKKLPLKCVDTGMGLERLATILQNVKNNYEIDLFKKIIIYIAKKINFKDTKNISLKIISDHLRASSFLIMDGILPNNNGHGYILRKIIRRAIIYGYKIGKKNIFFYKLVPIIIKEMSLSYPKLIKKKKKIQEIIKKEEILFKKTIKNGLKIFKKITKKEKIITGKTAFILHDTYGLNINLIIELCNIYNIKINIKEFNNEMKKQKNKYKNF